MATRKGTSKSEQPQTREDVWYAEATKAMAAERKYHEAETKRVEYELMELRTWERARREYDLATEVTEESAYELISTLSDWAVENRKPILLRLFSPGGDVVAGLAIYDFVLALRGAGLQVDTLALGWAASMASVLLQCGETRMVAPNASVLIHEERTTYTEGWTEKITDMEDRLAFGKSLDARMDIILAERSVYTPAQLRRRYHRKDWWLTAQECVEMGFADRLWLP